MSVRNKSPKKKESLEPERLSSEELYECRTVASLSPVFNLAQQSNLWSLTAISLPSPPLSIHSHHRNTC